MCKISSKIKYLCSMYSVVNSHADPHHIDADGSESGSGGSGSL